MFNKQDSKNQSGQLILTSQDTNLLSSSIFRRDQNWFTDKNPDQETKLYGLLDHQFYPTRKRTHKVDKKANSTFLYHI